MGLGVGGEGEGGGAAAGLLKAVETQCQSHQTDDICQDTSVPDVHSSTCVFGHCGYVAKHGRRKGPGDVNTQVYCGLMMRQ